ncbi:M20 aminoacylase family protein [Pseudomonas sp. NFIX28]|uniref:M20 aminoacylase family protein n=1 Tax=Pseudomonas sp. NFIX28 TaxID=1566235 RepID=UPI00089B6624|nr:M20 aminoacylase family protein [Pseudomonas sp. NFIX28]SDZ11767.1 hippurate hydrolase [Pseudomonas sp. NFIX28]
MDASAILPGIREITPSMIALRHEIHAHPELGFEEFETRAQVIRCLQNWGYDIHEGLGETGVVGTLRNGEGPAIGLRADMDALPIQETTGLPWASRVEGKMHACGHDGHTAMLLAAAWDLAKRRPFRGTLHLFFQPAEEGHGGSGAKRMLEDGLFDLFPCQAIFAMHNMPGVPLGKLGFLPGPFMASTDTATIRIQATGGHGAMPHKAVDPIVVCASLVMALQSIVSRNVPPLETAVITVGAIMAGEAPNVIPDTAQMRLSIRALCPNIRELLRQRIVALAEAQAAGFGARAEVDYEYGYPMLVNDVAATRLAEAVARDWLGEEGLATNMQPLTGSEDFAFWLEQVPGCYLIIGNGDGEGGCMVHNPGYDFNDQALPIGASYWVKLVERYLA